MHTRYFIILISFLIVETFVYAQPALSTEVIQKTYTHKKKLKNQLKTKDSDTYSFVEMSAIYVFENIQDTSYKYIRLFPDGRCFLSGWYLSKPNQYEFNDIVYGYRGYYIINSSEIIIYYYLDGYTKYVYCDGIISNKSILLKSRRPKLGHQEIILNQLYVLDENAILEDAGKNW